MSKKSKNEYLIEIRKRYLKENKEEKQKILDEFCRICKYNRKYAIRLINKKSLSIKVKKRLKPGPKAKYNTSGIVQFLKDLWMSTNLICSPRLKAIIPYWITCYKSEKNILTKKEETLLREISPATIDRLLSSFRGRYEKRGLSTTRPGSMIRELIPIKTEQWNESRPGFVEVDTVAHCGSNVSGEYTNTVNMVDIATGWTIQRAVWGKGETNTFKAIREIELTLPFKLKGFDCDNGKEFMNYRLLKYFKNRTPPVSYTRSRAYHKNDNSHIEEKNWTIVRQYIGYDRLDKPNQVEQLNNIYKNELYWLVNFFIASTKLKSKKRIGSKIKKIHDKPKTPFERLCDTIYIDEEKKLELIRLRNKLNPFELQRRIKEKLKLVHS
ncbi:MAG: ISNCY family transposase ISKol11 [Ignavibacteria bacterium]|nr:ISNCY family transposase ISKol11 [Ignavibacteria bacterium]